jgi:hypothetical protein
MKRTDMQSYLHIGGGKDGLSFPATDDAETLEWQVGVTDKELYNRSTLAVGDAVVTIYIHESLTQQQALNVLVGYYKAWAIHQPGGRL